MRPRSSRFPRPRTVLLCLGLFALQGTAAPPARRPSPLDGRFVFSVYGREDGLDDLNVECLLQDRTGFLWVGTDDGLFRFDGRHFVRAKDPAAVLDSRIQALHETKDGVLWIGTRVGLCRKDGERFVPVGKDAGLPSSPVFGGCLGSDAKGTVLVGTKSGLYEGGAGGFRLVPRPGGGEEVVVSSLLVDAGALFVARPGQIHRTDATGTAEIGAAGGLPQRVAVDGILRDGAGRLWVRTLKNLFVLGPDASGFERDDEGLPAASESGRLALDDRGGILVPTVEGLARKVEGAWKVMGRREGLPGDTVTAVFVDRESSLWIGMTGEGLARRLGPGAFTGGGEDAGLAHNVVWSIVREGRPDGPLWVGTERGLTRLDARDGSIRIIRESDGLGGDPVQCLAAAADGGVWAGSWPGGVTRIGPERGAIKRIPMERLEAASTRVGALFLGTGGDLWAGTASGLFRLPSGGGTRGFVRVPLPGASPEARLFAFAEDREGTLWAAGEGGLFRLTGSSPRLFGPADGLRSPSLSSLAALPDGSFVAGHREMPGADRIFVDGDRLTVKPLPPSSGGPRAKLVFLGVDFEGALWAGSGQGVSVYPKTGPPVHYERADGLLSDDMDQGAFFADADGTVWLGTSRGLVHYRPAGVETRRLPPPVVLLEVRAGARALDPAQPGVLARGERELRVSWAALTFVEPRRVAFRYRLTGLDEVFTETALDEARYPALPSGTYTFEVSAISAAGVPSANAAAFTFSVAKAWWEEWWARAFAALAALGLVVGFVHAQTRSLEKDRRRLEEAVAARSKELAAANRELSEVSVTDLLTGLRNRRYFYASIDADVAAARRVFADPSGEKAPRNKDLIFLIVDIDRFKEVNDVFGHHAGDRVLVEVARRLQGVVRRSDSLIRWGGEELLIVSRETERPEAHVLAERALAAISKEPFDLGDKSLLWRTCSVGWAPFPWLREQPDAVSYEDVLRLADRALYLAKTEGRHRAVGVLPLGTETGSPESIAAALKEPVLTGENATVRVIRSVGPDVPGS